MGKKGTILKELDDAIANRKKKIKESSPDSDEHFLFLRQLKALEEIDKYVSKYEWAGRDDVVDKVKFIRDSRYDYELVRKTFSMSASALKSFMFRINKRLGEKIGEDTIDLVISRYDKVSFGLIQFGICSGRYDMSDILVKDFYESLPNQKLDFFNIFDCKKEIEVMYFFSKFNMQQMLADCDMKKLAFLSFITQNPTERYKEEQKDLISLFQGINISFEDYMQKLNDLESEENYPFADLMDRMNSGVNKDLVEDEGYTEKGVEGLESLDSEGETEDDAEVDMDSSEGIDDIDMDFTAFDRYESEESLQNMEDSLPNLDTELDFMRLEDESEDDVLEDL